MTALTDVRNIIQQEEVSYRAGVSEGTFFRIGQTLNHISNKQYDNKDFFINGPYTQGAGTNGVDGLYFFPYDITVFQAVMFNVVSGSSGTTELDIKTASSSGGSFSSIFSTTPKISSGASNYAYTYSANGNSGTSANAPSGTTAPVISGGEFDIDANSVARIDIVSAMTGAENCGIILFFYPR